MSEWIEFSDCEVLLVRAWLVWSIDCGIGYAHVGSAQRANSVHSLHSFNPSINSFTLSLSSEVKIRLIAEILP